MDRPARSVFSSFVVILFLATSPAFAVTIDFDSPGDLTNNFNLNYNSSPSPGYIEVSSAGIANSGAVGYVYASGSDSADTTAVYNGAYNNLLGANVISVSAFVKFDPNTADGQLLQLGFLGDPAWQFRGGGYDESEVRTFVSVRVMHGTGNTVYFQTQQRWGTSSELQTLVWIYVSNNNLVTRELTPNNWYKLTGSFQVDPILDSDRIKTAGKLENWGAAGTAYTSTVYIWGSTFVNPNPIAGDAEVYAGFRSFNRGASMVDNFYADVVPEPLTAASVILGCGSLASYVRRRRK